MRTPLYFLPALLLLCPLSVLAQAGGSVGNGGGTLICKDGVKTLDSDEAVVRYHFKLDLPKHADWKRNAQELIDRLKPVSPMRVALYSRWLRTFESEWDPLSKAQFSETPDSKHVTIPDGCKFLQGVIQVRPRFPEEKRYFINQKVWPRLPADQKAMLVLHELFYREALSYGHEDSSAARYLTGLVSSTKMATLTEASWIQRLQYAHFELSDVKLDAPLDSEFDPSVLWRAGPNDTKEAMSPIALKGDVVASIGRCRGDGCEAYEPRSIRGESSSPRDVLAGVCKGLVSLTHGSIRMYDFGLQPDCSLAVTVSVFSRDHRRVININPSKEDRAAFTTVGLARHQRAAFTHSLTLIEPEGGSESFRLAFGEFSTLIRDSELESAPGISEILHGMCPLEVTFSEQGEITRLSGIRKVLGGCAPGRQPIVRSVSFIEGVRWDIEGTFSDEHPSADVIQGLPARNSRMPTGYGRILQASTITTPMVWMQSTGDHGPGGAYDQFMVVLDDQQRPGKIVVQESAALVFNQDRRFDIAAGTYELYPTAVPKEVVLAEPATHAGFATPLPAGTRIRFNEQGGIVSHEPPH